MIDFRNIKSMDLVLDTTLAQRGLYLVMAISSAPRVITVVPFDSIRMEEWTEMSYIGDQFISSGEEWT